MDSTQTRLLSLVSGLVNVSERRQAAKVVAEEIGAEDLIIFIPDNAIGMLLPASGFPQTLPDFPLGGSSWPHAIAKLPKVLDCA